MAMNLATAIVACIVCYLLGGISGVFLFAMCVNASKNEKDSEGDSTWQKGSTDLQESQ